jgi:hypothetical protein
VDIASVLWLNPSMRRVLPRMCCLLALASVARAQTTWDFGTGVVTGTPTLLPTNITSGTITATNTSSAIAFNGISASSTYTGATGGNNAVVSSAIGTLNTSTSTYFAFSLTAASGTRLLATGLKLGSRSTSTGPTTLTLYSSTDNFATSTQLGSVSVSNNSTWALMTFPSFSVTSATGGSLSFRLYGSTSNTTSGSSNWRIDDLALTIIAASPGPTTTTQPVDTNVSPGQTATFIVAATGTGTLTYQWRKPSATIPP